MNKLKLTAIGLTASLLALVGCKSEVYDTVPNTGATGCDTLDYVKHIEPIFKTYCVSCHFDGGPAPGNFNDVAVITARLDKINDRVFVRKDMPPRGSSQLSSAESSLLKKWIDCGGPLGSTPPTPPTPKDTTGPSFATELKPLFQAKCTGCHDGSGPGVGPGDFNIYNDVKRAVDSANLEGRVFVIQDMPQGDTLSVQQRILLKKWLEKGAPNN